MAKFAIFHWLVMSFFAHVFCATTRTISSSFTWWVGQPVARLPRVKWFAFLSGARGMFIYCAKWVRSAGRTVRRAHWSPADQPYHKQSWRASSRHGNAQGVSEPPTRCPCSICAGETPHWPRQWNAQRTRVAWQRTPARTPDAYQAISRAHAARANTFFDKKSALLGCV